MKTNVLNKMKEMCSTCIITILAFARYLTIGVFILIPIGAFQVLIENNIHGWKAIIMFPLLIIATLCEFWYIFIPLLIFVIMSGKYIKTHLPTQKNKTKEESTND